MAKVDRLVWLREQKERERGRERSRERGWTGGGGSVEKRERKENGRSVSKEGREERGREYDRRREEREDREREEREKGRNLDRSLSPNWGKTQTRNAKDSISETEKSENKSARNSVFHREINPGTPPYYIQPPIHTQFSYEKSVGRNSTSQKDGNGSVRSSKTFTEIFSASGDVAVEKEIENLKISLSKHPQERKRSNKIGTGGGNGTKYMDVQKIKGKTVEKKVEKDTVSESTTRLESRSQSPSPRKSQILETPLQNSQNNGVRQPGSFFKNFFARSKSPIYNRRNVRSRSPLNNSNLSSNQVRESVRRLSDNHRDCVVTSPASRNEKRHYEYY